MTFSVVEMIVSPGDFFFHVETFNPEQLRHSLFYPLVVFCEWEVKIPNSRRHSTPSLIKTINTFMSLQPSDVTTSCTLAFWTHAG